MAGMSRSGCVPVDKKIEQLQNIVNELTVNGLTYTAGCGVTIVGTEIAAAVDGVSIVCSGGVLSAIAASDLVAGCGIDITLGVISAAVDGTTIICDGGVLSATVAGIINCFTTIAVSGQDSVVADSSSDTVNFAAGTAIVITTNATTDTVTWSLDTSALAAEFTGGAGITITSLTWTADIWTGSHLGFTDGSGVDDATDDGKLAIQWHAVSGYNSSGNFLYGTADGDTTKPVVRLKTVAAWLKTLPDYDDSTPMLLLSDGGADGNEIRWATISESLSLLTGYVLANLQSIGKDAGTGPEWQDDDDECP